MSRSSQPRVRSSLLPLCHGTYKTQMTARSWCLHRPACLYQADLFPERSPPPYLQPSTSRGRVGEEGARTLLFSLLTPLLPQLHQPEPKLTSGALLALCTPPPDSAGMLTSLATRSRLAPVSALLLSASGILPEWAWPAHASPPSPCPRLFWTLLLCSWSDLLPLTGHSHCAVTPRAEEGPVCTLSTLGPSPSGACTEALVNGDVDRIPAPSSTQALLGLQPRGFSPGVPGLLLP